MMQGLGLLTGLLAALALLALGLMLLPEPDFNSLEGLFAGLWLCVALAAAAAFGREVWRRERLKASRQKLRRSGGYRRLRSPAGNLLLQEREEFIRQRGRRTDL